MKEITIRKKKQTTFIITSVSHDISSEHRTSVTACSDPKASVLQFNILEIHLISAVPVGLGESTGISVG